jgi:phosphatidate cytidylyltransferase
MSELRQRVITGAVAVPVVVAAILGLSSPWFGLLLGMLAVAGAWEWGGLTGVGSRAGYAAATALVLLVVERVLVPGQGAVAVMLAGVGWWLVALAWVVGYQQGRDPRGLDHPLASALCGWLILVPCWTALRVLHGTGEQGPRLVLVLLVLVWLADTGAYFAGRRFGTRRLASRVSPGKTREGLAGAVAAVVVAGVAFALGAGIVASAIPTFVALCVVTAVASVVGDLAESVFKRRAGVKDSGVLFPGHGGVLDRIDSITAAAPCFVLGLALLGGA